MMTLDAATDSNACSRDHMGLASRRGRLVAVSRQSTTVLGRSGNQPQWRRYQLRPGDGSGDGSYGIPFGDKTEILLGLDGSAARLEAGLTTGFRRWGPQQGNA
jgi:hypothetical protein